MLIINKIIEKKNGIKKKKKKGIIVIKMLKFLKEMIIVKIWFIYMCRYVFRSKIGNV